MQTKIPFKIIYHTFPSGKKERFIIKTFTQENNNKGFSREFKNIFRVVTDHMCGVDNRSDQLTKILDFNLTDLQKIQLRDP